MVRRVPASPRNVNPASERDGIIDHDDLLMVAASRWMVAIEMEMQAPLGQPIEQEEWRCAANGHFQ